ncbi:hypothetical protein I7I48_11329 [Histoplasma ohiense]|nr:hypothetical protein I7I48_11329 [Histoplasma ohiense (nom. inval.)]
MLPPSCQVIAPYHSFLWYIPTLSTTETTIFLGKKSRPSYLPRGLEWLLAEASSFLSCCKADVVSSEMIAPELNIFHDDDDDDDDDEFRSQEAIHGLKLPS